jgi:hypothetical protein
MRRIVLLVAAGIVCASCTTVTETWWESTNPHDWIYISAEDITPAELERRGVKYEVYPDKTCHGYLLLPLASGSWQAT